MLFGMTGPNNWVGATAQFSVRPNPENNRMPEPKTFTGNFQWQRGERLGEGGQAQVYRATKLDDAERAEFALKVLKSKNPSPKACERFRREMQAVQTLDHPNIVRVVDSYQGVAAPPFYVMNLVEGARPLGKLIRQPNNPFEKQSERCVELFCQLTSALVHCQEQQIVHRDISPGNVLVTPDHRIQLIDFGLCWTDDTGQLTSIDEGAGTQNYMAPECDSGAHTAPDVRSDLYSVGKLVWTAVTGRQAFAREEPVFQNLALEEVLPDHPQTWHLAHIFEKTIRADPANRWQSAREAHEFGTQLRNVLRRGISPVQHIHRWCDRCGVGELRNATGAFGALSAHEGYVSKRCDYCGTYVLHNRKVPDERLEARKQFS